MKLVKALLIIAAALVLIGGGLWHFKLKEQFVYAGVGTSYGAKHVCSCIHVAGRELDSCQRDLGADMQIIKITDNGQVTRASVLGGLISAKAVYTPGLGCSLIP